MSRLSQSQFDALLATIRQHDFLQRLCDEIDKLQRVVFHANERADWDRARRSAEQILAAEIHLRHRGDPLGLYYTLRNMEDSGKPWDAAIRDVSTGIHSYFTTPLGIVIRHDLFGNDVVFLSPDAKEWIKSASAEAKASESA
ncbi:MAG: hypothetical protein AB7Q17_00180 [Phycisphaerae bacterium]